MWKSWHQNLKASCYADEMRFRIVMSWYIHIYIDKLLFRWRYTNQQLLPKFGLLSLVKVIMDSSVTMDRVDIGYINFLAKYESFKKWVT